MMSFKERERIDELCVKRLKEFFGDKLNKLQDSFSTEKRFTEYYESNLDFSQIFCKIKLPGLVDKRVQSNISVEEAIEFNLLANEINTKLIEIQKDIVLKELSEFQTESYLYFSRVSDNLGICNLSIYSRNKSKEELENKQEQENIKQQLNENNNLRKDYNWHNEEYRPYGGAFECLEDYYKYIS